jgi:glycolate oxidase
VAAAGGDGIVIALTRMRAVLEVDLPNQRILVEPGVTNTEVSKAVGPTHFYPPDPSSQIVCSIGGNVAENSGGAHCFKYGFTTNYVCGLEGRPLRRGGGRDRRPAPRRPGLRPARCARRLGGHARGGHQGLASGDAGARVVRTLAAFFDSPEAAGEAVSAIVGAGVVPGAIELMDNLTIQAAELAVHAGWPTDAGAALVIELDGSETEVECPVHRHGALLRRRGRHRGARGRRRRGARALLEDAQGRRSPAMGRLSASYYVQDGVIPRTRLPEILRRIAELGEEYGMRVANVFHAGDGNLHPLVCYSGEEEAERAEELSGEILKACVDAGGSITGEHGVGVDKKRYMPRMFEEPDLAAFQKLRCAFDPHGLANPAR